jgi:hypothetical protein
MTDAELRALVRDAVARHLGAGRGGVVAEPAAPPAVVVNAAVAHVSVAAEGAWSVHPSHHRYLSLSAPDGACVIEPAVGCDHCGYCKSHGH